MSWEHASGSLPWPSPPAAVGPWWQTPSGEGQKRWDPGPLSRVLPWHAGAPAWLPAVSCHRALLQGDTSIQAPPPRQDRRHASVVWAMETASWGSTHRLGQKGSGDQGHCSQDDPPCICAEQVCCIGRAVPRGSTELLQHDSFLLLPGTEVSKSDLFPDMLFLLH